MLIAKVSRVLHADPTLVARSLTELDSDEYGGAPLLGVGGVSIISHGKSSPRALQNAIGVAIRAVQSDMIGEIGRRLEAAEAVSSTTNGNDE